MSATRLIRTRTDILFIITLLLVSVAAQGAISIGIQVLGGAIDSDAADKAARFLQLCDAFDISRCVAKRQDGNVNCAMPLTFPSCLFATHLEIWLALRQNVSPWYVTAAAYM